MRRFAAGAALVLALAGAVRSLAWAGDGDGATAEARIREVEAAPPALQPVAAELVVRSRAALARAAKLRSAGDEAHAKLAEATARTWAEAARDALRAAEVEDRAAVVRLTANDAGTMAERERALLEEGVAQAGRLRAQLEGVARAPRASDAGAPRTTTKDGGTR